MEQERNFGVLVYKMCNMEEFYDAVDWPWEERKKIDEDKQDLEIERQSVDCERNRVENEKDKVQWERRELEQDKTSFHWEC